MFESLDDQLKVVDRKTASSRMLGWGLGILIAILVFGGLYLGVHLLQG